MLLSMIQLLVGLGSVFLLAGWAIDRDTVGIIAGLLGAFAWFVGAYGLFNIETVGQTTTHSEPAIALLAAGAGLVCLTPALVNPWEIISNANDQDDPLERV